MRTVPIIYQVNFDGQAMSFYLIFALSLMSMANTRGVPLKQGLGQLLELDTDDQFYKWLCSAVGNQIEMLDKVRVMLKSLLRL